MLIIINIILPSNKYTLFSILFLLFINDIFFVIKYPHILFITDTDNTNIFKTSRYEFDALQLQSDLSI